MKQKSALERYVEAMGKAVDITMQLHLQKQMIKEKMLSERELDRIADKVLSRISIRLEDEAISQLRDMLKNLGGV